MWLTALGVDELPDAWPVVGVENVRGAGSLIVLGLLLGAFASWES